MDNTSVIGSSIGMIDENDSISVRSHRSSKSQSKTSPPQPPPQPQQPVVKDTASVHSKVSSVVSRKSAPIPKFTEELVKPSPPTPNPNPNPLPPPPPAPASSPKVEEPKSEAWKKIYDELMAKDYDDPRTNPDGTPKLTTDDLLEPSYPKYRGLKCKSVNKAFGKEKPCEAHSCFPMTTCAKHSKKSIRIIVAYDPTLGIYVAYPLLPGDEEEGDSDEDSGHKKKKQKKDTHRDMVAFSKGDVILSCENCCENGCGDLPTINPIARFIAQAKPGALTDPSVLPENKPNCRYNKDKTELVALEPIRERIRLIACADGE